jgi:hypothetical protein
MVKGLLRLATILLNAFLSSAGISDSLSPCNIVQGLFNLDFAQLNSSVTNTQAVEQKECLCFIQVDYMEAGHFSLLPLERKSMEEDSHPYPSLMRSLRELLSFALYLRGLHGIGVLSLTIGKEVHGRTFTPLPIIGKVIERVVELAAAQGQPIIHDGRLLYELRC